MWQAGDFLLYGPVEADETYIGGKETNKHKIHKLKAGRGIVGKTPMAGVKDWPTKQMRVQVIQPANRAAIQERVCGRARRPRRDEESSTYDGLPNH